ncbi:hypothetical protein S2M10_30630 [Sphingomonas sp. S2M10]|nr:hypothetical protein [Sphingomonas sp. S2M10]
MCVGSKSRSNEDKMDWNKDHIRETMLSLETDVMVWTTST